MSMLRKIVATLVSLIAALLLSIGLAGTATAQPVAVDPTAAPVTGTLADGTGAVAGTFDVQNFVVENGTLQAVGTFTGTVTDAAGNPTQGTQQTGDPGRPRAKHRVLQILDLVLGPLDLDLLGLQVHLDTVHLNITAQSGPGELVGNLLCAIAGLSTADSHSTRSSARSRPCSTNCSASWADPPASRNGPFRAAGAEQGPRGGRRLRG